MKIVRSLALLVLFVGCTSVGTQAPRPEPQSKESPPRLANDVHWTRNSAEYRAVVIQTFALAVERLREVVAGKERGTWAVAADADETIINNSAYNRELTLVGIDSTSELWDAWVARRAAPPLPGAIEFLELAHELGGHIAIVTNRSEQHCTDTQANFRAHDIPFDVMLCRTEGRRKEPRWEMVEEGTASPDLPPLEIVLWLGDNIRDFPTLDQDIRLEDLEAFSDFGSLYFIMPNPMYGSWIENPQD